MQTNLAPAGLPALSHLLVRTQTSLCSRVDTRLRSAHGLTPADYGSMAYLAGRPVAPLGDVATALAIASGSTRKVASRVEATVHLRRAAHPDGCRSAMLGLTSSGQRLQTGARHTFAAAPRELLAAPEADRRPDLEQNLLVLRRSAVPDVTRRIA